MPWPYDESGAGPQDSDAGNTWPKRFGYMVRVGSAKRARMEGEKMNAFSFSLVVLYFASLVSVGASFAAEGLGLPQTQSVGGVTVKVTSELLTWSGNKLSPFSFSRETPRRNNSSEGWFRGTQCLSC